MTENLSREQLIAAAQAVGTIIDYRKWRDDLEKLVDENSRPNNPIEFLCLSIGGKTAGCFPKLAEAYEWVKRYRRLESQRMADFDNGERRRSPIGILVATDLAPTDINAWREDAEIRERLGEQGALILDRPEAPSPASGDDSLFLEIIAMAIHEPGFVPRIAPAAGFDPEWKPADPVGQLGEEYGRQPSSIDPPETDLRQFHQRFDAYSPGQPGVEF